MRQARSIALAMSCFVTASPSYGGSAVDKFWDEDMPKNYGCGPGNVIFGEDSWLSTYMASTVNMSSSSLLPTSTTSKISGCNSGPTIVSNERGVRFLAENYDEVLREAASGGGEVLTTFAQIMGLRGSRQDQFSLAVQRNYIEIFGTGRRDPSVIFENLKKYI